MERSLDLLGGEPPRSPVVLSVPHGGRDYPASLIAALRVPSGAMIALEDRHIDAVALAAREGRTAIVARRARAWIDLNRGEDERDPRVDEGARAMALPMRSSKVRSGLGLVPRRAASASELWRRRFSDAEIAERIAGDHRPYHAAVAAALSAARARFGIAILLDLHSMPPLGRDGPKVVIGDRFGRAAGARFVARVEAVAAASGHRVALNTPYAGGHILDTHGAPPRGVHAIQLELDRSLYLDPALDRPGAGLAATATLVARMLAALEDEAAGSGLFARAAE
ncbi:N-formylglutamate amidohydrolase [Sphingomonas sp.]|uniref:N-formylglutamate amidohydrolase n=1 Tax=Sphingomonas sp. TaxID=28214 RepID=UPI0035BBE6B8